MAKEYSNVNRSEFDLPKDSEASDGLNVEQMKNNATKERIFEKMDVFNNALKDLKDNEMIDSVVMLMQYHERDFEKEENKEPKYSIVADGMMITSLDVAMTFLVDYAHQMVGMQHDSDNGGPIDKRLSRGLGLSFIKQLITEFDLDGDDVDLNELKKPYESLFEQSDEIKEEIDKSVEQDKTEGE